jgi:hypothetical protein
VTRSIDYPDLLCRATLGLVREVLELAAADGLPGEHHFFLTFRTTDPGVEIPGRLLAQYPETLTIVLQNQFWDLEVEEDGFMVTLRFGSDYERLRVPFAALTAFLDPSVPFGLDFTQFVAARAEDAREATGEEPATQVGADEDPAARPPSAGDVLPFRRREP